MTVGNDAIVGDVGDRNRNIAIGKQIRQRNQEAGNQVYNQFHFDQERVRKRNSWPPFAVELDEEMIDLVKVVEKILGEIALVKYRLRNLEAITIVGIALYIVVLILLVMIAFQVWQ